MKAVAGKTYRHYKGGKYYVHAIGLHTESEEEVVIYCSLDKNPEKIWVRPKEMFEEQIEFNGQLIDRFIMID